MPASSVTGRGQGSAEGHLRGFTIDLIHKVIQEGTGKPIVRIEPEDTILIDSELDLTDVPIPPSIERINSKLGIVYFNNPSGNQIEVYKYTYKQAGINEKIGISDRLGKRFRPMMQLPLGTTSWTISDIWIHPTPTAVAAGKTNPKTRNYFAFGTRTQSGIRSDLSSQTVITATNAEYIDSVKILLNSAYKI